MAAETTRPYAPLIESSLGSLSTFLNIHFIFNIIIISLTKTKSRQNKKKNKKTLRLKLNNTLGGVTGEGAWQGYGREARCLSQARLNA